MKKNLVIALCCIVMIMELVCILKYTSDIDSLSCELEELKKTSDDEEFIVMNDLTDEDVVRASLAKFYDLNTCRLEITEIESGYDPVLEYWLYDENGELLMMGISHISYLIYEAYNDYMLVPKD